MSLPDQQKQTDTDDSWNSLYYFKNHITICDALIHLWRTDSLCITDTK